MNLINKLFFLGDAKRKVILINPEFQLKVINSIVYFFLLVISIFYAVNWYFFYQLKENGIKAGVPLNSDYFIFIEQSSRQMSLIFFVTAFISMILIYYFGLILSHRIAGPIYNINRSFDYMIKSKQIKKISLRKNDYFQEHADKINEFLEEIQNDDLK